MRARPVTCQPVIGLYQKALLVTGGPIERLKHVRSSYVSVVDWWRVWFEVERVCVKVGMCGNARLDGVGQVKSYHSEYPLLMWVWNSSSHSSTSNKVQALTHV